MIRKKGLSSFSCFQPFCLTLVVLACCLLRSTSFAQKFSVSFPIGSTVYQGSEIPLTTLIEGVKCENTVIKCHQGKVAMVNHCQYIYRCQKVGIDTIELYIRKGEKLQKVGEQQFVVKERPVPEAQVGGLRGGNILKGMLRAQQGVAAHFYVAGNHWESCPVERFNFIVLRNNKVVMDFYNEGLYFTAEVKDAMQHLEHGDKVLITNIRGCIERGGGMLKTLEFVIE